MRNNPREASMPDIPVRTTFGYRTNKPMQLYLATDDIGFSNDQRMIVVPTSAINERIKEINCMWFVPTMNPHEERINVYNGEDDP